ncbi:hypothetical protein BGX26_004784 [Mortierella sp. AD094]|nr:hypothetical protein BGX26_004784 [Mortierella sp. AD094]
MASLSDMDKKQPYRNEYESPQPLPQLPYNPETVYHSTTSTNIPLSAPSPFGPSFASTSSNIARVPSSSSSSSASSAWTKAEEKAIKKDRKEQEKLAKQLQKDAEKERKAQEKLIKQQSKGQADSITKEIKHHANELKRELSHQTKEAVRVAKNELANVNSRGSSSCDRNGCGSSSSSTRAYPSSSNQQPLMYAPPSVSPPPVSTPPVAVAVYQAHPPTLSPQQLALQHEQARLQCNYNKKLYKEQHRMDRHERRQQRRLEREIRREQRHHRVPFPFGLVTLGPRIVGGVVSGVASRMNHSLSGPSYPNQYPENTNTIMVTPAPLPQGSVYPPQGPVYPPQQSYAPPAQPMPQHYPERAPSINSEKKSIGAQDPLLVYSMSNLTIHRSVSPSPSAAPPAPSAPPMPASHEDEDTSAPPPYEVATLSQTSTRQ